MWDRSGLLAPKCWIRKYINIERDSNTGEMKLNNNKDRPQKLVDDMCKKVNIKANEDYSSTYRKAM